MAGSTTKPYSQHGKRRIMMDFIKKEGKVNISELSAKQVIALLNLWNKNHVKVQNTSFSEMLGRCYKTTPWHENSPIVYVYPDESCTTVEHHAFYDMTEGEEEKVMSALKSKL